MTEYQSLIWPDAAPITPGKKSSAPRMHLRGCEYCPMNGQPHIRKIKGTVEGKAVFVWAQSPGKDENGVGKELIGPSGKWFWKRMAVCGPKRKDGSLQGITREECDIQNVMRCFPAEYKNHRFEDHIPTKEELFCCSVYTDRAIVKSRAKVHIVLGLQAAKALFGMKKFSAGNNIFWSDKLNGKVIVLKHPAYFLRRGGSGTEIDERNFRVGLQAAWRMAHSDKGKFSHLEEQDYEGIITADRARQVADAIRKQAKEGVRVSVDIEDAVVDGHRCVLCVGFSWRRGMARVFLIDHPHPTVSSSVRGDIKRIVVELLEDATIKKVCQHGSYDATQSDKILGCKFRGYDYDTNYSEYFAYPGRRSYALSEIAAVRFPDFVGYKEIVMPEAAPAGMSYQEAYRKGKLDFAKIPWKKMVLYNGADCDLTKRIEADPGLHKKEAIPIPLLHVYMDAAFTLDRMEKNGPWFDSKQCDILGKIYPARIAKKRQALELMAGDPEFNVNNPVSVSKIIYGKLKLPMQGNSLSTGKEILEILAAKHPFPRMVIEYRKDVKLDSTYRVGFQKCAEFHKGRLFTKWWLTGTKSGRISSGGSRDGETFVTVNLQNIHGDPQVQNMLVSDLHWRDTYKAWKDESEHNENWYKEFLERYIYLILDYSQNELRFLAQSADDPLLIQQFNSGEDIHCQVGHELTGWSIEKIKNDKQTRKLVKNFHFGMVYGLTVDGMFDYLRVNKVTISRSRVDEMMKAYFKKYSKVKDFIEAMRAMAEGKGYVENALGFRCPIHVSEEKGGAYWGNQAVNLPIQGGAHQLLLIALAALKRKPVTYNLIRVPNMEIHDSLITSNRVCDLRDAFKQAVKLLEHEVLDVLLSEFKLKWKVPLVAEAKVGFRFGVGVDFAEDMKLRMMMNKWCEKNQESQQALFAELRKVERRKEA